MKGTHLESQNNRKCIDLSIVIRYLSLIETLSAEKYEIENSMQQLKKEKKMA